MFFIVNEVMFLITVLAYLGGVLVTYKVFGKSGLYVFSIFATLLSCIADLKCINVLGFPTNAGMVLYASTFLVTDILSEKYGKKSAEKAVYYSLAAMLLWVIGTQLTVALTPNVNDQMNSHICSVFGFAPRIFLASMAGYIVSQNFDVFMYHFIWKKTGNNRTMLWLRNNGSTMLSQAIDTVIFVTLAFWGMYPLKVFLSVLLTSYVVKASVALLDTPFIYLARKIKPLRLGEENSENSNNVDEDTAKEQVLLEA